MPNSYIHTIYKEYVTMLKDNEKSEQHASEEVMDQIEDSMT